MKKAIIYTEPYCGYCARAKTMLEQHGIEYEEIDVFHDEEKRKEMEARSGRKTVPQIFLAIGGCDDLYDFLKKGELTPILEQK